MRARYSGAADASKHVSAERVAMLADIDAAALYNAVGKARHNSVGSDNLLACIIALGYDIEVIAHVKELNNEQQEALYGPRRTLAQRIASTPGHRRARSEMPSHDAHALRWRIQGAATVARARKAATPASTSTKR